jgi:hypothetical protein
MMPARLKLDLVLSLSKDGHARQAVLRQAQHGVGASGRRRHGSSFPRVEAEL